MVSHVQIFEWTLNQLIYLLMEKKKVVVGIDLGTTTSCAFVPYNGRLENIVHLGNRNIIDSVIKSTPTGAAVLTVDTAAHARQLEGKGCVYEAKRLIGRKYAEVKKEVDRNEWPFEVFEGDDGYAAIRVTLRYKGSDGKIMEEKRELYPEEVGAYILRDIRKRAERLLDCSVDSCVIGCPVDFSFEQRKRTVEAAVLAGFTLDNISLYPESTLAAIAYAEEYDREATKPRVYLVYDFGGGTFDVSIVKRNGSKYETIATEGDGNCGGKDIDVRLMKVIREDLKDEGYEINENRLSKMKFACKQMKELLLTNSSYDMCCDFVRHANEDDYPVKRMTSAAVDAIAKPVIEKTLGVVKRLLKKKSYTVNDIDYVFMAGGSSKLNGVRVSLEKLFGSEKVKCDTTCLCEAAIAKGAALVSLSNVLPVDPVPTPPIDPGVAAAHIDDPFTSSAIMQSVGSEVEPVPKPPYKPIVPPAPEEDQKTSSTLIDTMPYSVVIKTADGEVELVPKGELLDHEFFKYVFPSSTFNSAVIEFGVRNGNALTPVGSISIPVNSQKDVKAQPLRVEATMEGSGEMNVCVKNEVDSSMADYKADINLLIDAKSINAISKSVRLNQDQDNQDAMEELRTDIQAIYETVRYGGDKLDNEAIRKEWLTVVKKSESCHSVEELKVLKEKIEKMRNEL